MSSTYSPRSHQPELRHFGQPSGGRSREKKLLCSIGFLSEPARRLVGGGRNASVGSIRVRLRNDPSDSIHLFLSPAIRPLKPSTETVLVVPGGRLHLDVVKPLLGLIRPIKFWESTLQISAPLRFFTQECFADFTRRSRILAPPSPRPSPF